MVVLVDLAERVRFVDDALKREAVNLQQRHVVGGRRADPLDLADLAANDHVADLAGGAVVVEEGRDAVIVSSHQGLVGPVGDRDLTTVGLAQGLVEAKDEWADSCELLTGDNVHPGQWGGEVVDAAGEAHEPAIGRLSVADGLGL